jgi:steroid delta-isomerase-like uncharacterized protein
MISVASELTETEQHNLRTVLQMIEALNAQDIDGMLSCMDEDMEWFDIPMEEPYRGKDEIRPFLGDLFAAFPDLLYDPSSIIVRGDNVSVEFRMYGTHSNTFYGLPATKRTAEIPCHTAIVMRNGKVLSDWCYFDNSMILRQLGLMPSLTATFSPPGRAALWVAVKGKRFLPAIAGAVITAVSLSRLRKALAK